MQHSDSRDVVVCRPTECQQSYDGVTAMHDNEHMQETMGTSVEIPGVKIPEFAESITSVQVLTGELSNKKS